MESCQVLNFTDGQIIDYEIVIIRGFSTLPSPFRMINKSSAPQESENPGLTSFVNENAVIFNCIEDPVEHEKQLFVALVELVVGDNVLSLCDTENNQHYLLKLIYQPKVSICQVRGLLIHFSDSDSCEDLIRSQIRRINFALKLVQSIFADKLQEIGFNYGFNADSEISTGQGQHRTFNLSTDYGMDSIISIPHTTTELATMNDIWTVVGKNIRKNDKLWSENIKNVAIMNKIEDGSTLSLRVHGIGVGGLATLSSNLAQWPTNLKELQTMIHEDRFNEGVNNREFLNLAWLGGLTHEVAHIFDLGHTPRGLMGYDFFKAKHIFWPRRIGNRKYQDVWKYQHIIENSQDIYFIPKIIVKSATGQLSLSEDLVALNLSSAAILYYHRWLLPSPSSMILDSGPTLVLNKISASCGICAIEIRELPLGLVLKSWTFKSEANNYITNFTLKRSHFSIFKENPEILIQDFKGNILKMTIDPNSLPEGYTEVKRFK